MRKIIISIGLVLSSMSAFAQDDNINLNDYETPAPTGLTWGISQFDMTEAGYNLSGCESSNNLTICSYIPKKTIENAIYAVVFENKFGLIQELTSIDLEKDNNSGTLLVPAYLKYKNELVNKYGQPVFASEYSSESMITNPNSFSSCLKTKNCAMYMSRFSKNGSNANIFIAPISDDDSRLIIDYRSAIYDHIVDNLNREANSNNTI